MNPPLFNTVSPLLSNASYGPDLSLDHKDPIERLVKANWWTF